MTGNVPNWSAAEDGFPANGSLNAGAQLDATNSAGQLNQFLGTHAIIPVYQGSQILTSNGGNDFVWVSTGNGVDFSQPFTMSGTNIGRVVLPLQMVGNGGDVLVTLCPDSSGSPNTAAPIASCLVPASWISQLGAPGGLPSGGPLATAFSNSYALQGGVATTGWPGASGPGGALTNSSFTTSGNYAIFAGGYTSASIGFVNTAQFTGSGAMAAPLPQPAIPTPVNLAGLAATTDTLVCVGGLTAAGIATATTNVWTASWNSSSGTVGSWSLQAALPVALSSPTVVTSGETIYVIGGANTSGNAVSTVYFATVSNGQISSWSSATSYPTVIYNPFSGIFGGFLLVAGGTTTTSGANGVASVYYAPIHADGSLGAWAAGPSLALAVSASVSSGSNQLVTTDALVVLGGINTSGITTSQIQILTMTATGPAPAWQLLNWAHQESLTDSAFDLGNGSWAAFALDAPDQLYEFSTLIPTPMLSVPLLATGLTNGGTYHVVLQQHQTASAADYLNFGVQNGTPLPTSALRSNRHSGVWTTYSSGWAIPMQVYNNTASGPVVHTWEDQNPSNYWSGGPVASRATTQVYNYLNLLQGYCESTAFPNNALNSNPTFTSGVSPWTAVNGTLTQSSAQTQGGFAFSGLLTPTGGFSTAYAESENIPVNSGANAVQQGSQWFIVNGWFYSPTGWSNFDLQMNWFASTGAYMSTSFLGTTSLAANTWTQVTHYVAAPAGSAFGGINPTLAGSPGATNLLYMSNVTLVKSPEIAGTLSSVSQINYASGTQWPPTGVTLLA